MSFFFLHNNWQAQEERVLRAPVIKKPNPAPVKKSPNATKPNRGKAPRVAKPVAAPVAAPTADAPVV
jgi:hypothetical protein